MPRDYSKTVIYELVCKDLAITHRYVGSTTDIIRRRNMHKSTCNNDKQPLHNTKLYQTIRNNGGWVNWEIKIIEKFPCNSNIEACIREREVFDRLTPTLNKNRPHITLDEKKELASTIMKKYYIDHTEQLKLYQTQYGLRQKLDKINEILDNVVITEN